MYHNTQPNDTVMTDLHNLADNKNANRQQMNNNNISLYYYNNYYYYYYYYHYYKW